MSYQWAVRTQRQRIEHSFRDYGFLQNKSSATKEHESLEKKKSRRVTYKVIMTIFIFPSD